MSLDAMKQALEALESNPDAMVDCGDGHWDFKRDLAITALRAAIEQAETPEKRRAKVDPIRVRIMQEAYDLADRNDSEGYNSVKVMCSEVLSMINRLLDERQPEQEPVAWYDSKTGWTDFHAFKPVRQPSAPDAEWLPLYTAPRQWQGLTDDDIAQAMYRADAIITGPMQFKFAREIEAKLKEKNT